MVEDGDQEMLVELKGVGKLFSHLPHTVNELDKDGRPLVVTVVLVSMSDALRGGQSKVDRSTSSQQV